MNSVVESKQGEPGVTVTEQDDGRVGLDVLRRFHYGEPSAAAATNLPGISILPALLNPYRDASAIRYQYPLYLSPAGGDGPVATALSEYLRESLEAFAPGEAAKILKDNLPWLERDLRQRLEGPAPADAPAVFADAARALVDHLELTDANKEKLEADLAHLATAMEDGGTLLGYGPDVPLYLLIQAVRRRHTQRREQLRERIAVCVQGLQSLLDVEKAKSADGNEPGAVRDSVGPASQHLDTDALSEMLDTRAHGSVEMPAERRQRIENALAELQDWQDDAVLVRFVGKLENEAIGELPEVDVVDSDNPCVAASEAFEHEAERHVRLFVALRVGELEIDDGYDPEVHDSWFASFDWQTFSHDELQLVTQIVALASADHIAGEGLPAFSRLLGSRLPVHVLSWVRAYDNPAARPGEGPFDSWRFELANFGVGHRQVVVAQTSAARHEDLLSGFLCALDSDRTSVHLINRGTQSKAKLPLLDAWFVASAALESRAHPFLLVDPDAGDRAAQRVRFGGNPQADSDWPVEKLEYRTPEGEVAEMELAFTFADYALLMPALHEHFRRVPPELESDDLVTVAEYLEADVERVDRLVPFVWGIDAEGVLMRFVTSRALVFACRDRLNYWHSLQELAGVQNYYVEEAIERIIEEQRAALDAEREQLQKEHAAQLETVRTEAAGEAMGQLVDVLMGADLSGMVAGGSQIATMPAATPAEELPPTEEAAAEPEPEREEEAEEELSFDEPWLDTPACTTCDDCMGINKMMFAYNDDKQAYLVDPKAGTFEDLVRAAEICPAKCIHPGKPLNPNEPGLDELMARAAPFN
jgi:ferredoxin